ncbi:hypothetical protein ACN4EK_24395 [Pantanalinema rosaneae CENA516]|uniref:hypothetical protein n=1 Tax=Pantanalinema rosaneae TaxID=1620701 RepID=UPI003D6F10E2
MELEYEFTTRQEDILWRLAMKMRNVAYFWMLSGIAGLGGGLFDLIQKTPDQHQVLLQSLKLMNESVQVNMGDSLKYIFTILILSPYMIVIGFTSLRASIALKKVVMLEGQDITNLMSAIKQIDRKFTFHYFLIVILILLMWIEVFLGS